MTNVASQVNIRHALTIQGWMSEDELTWLATMAQECDTIVEFGSYHGRSSRAIADNMGPDARLWCVDPWSGEYPVEIGEIINTFVMPEFKQNLEDHIKLGRVIPVRMFSHSFNLPFKVDMLFIDGDHRFDSVVEDILWGINHVESGGIISGHDYFPEYGWQGVKDAVDKFFPARKVVDTIWWNRAF
jgi:Methyltransferase domain